LLDQSAMLDFAQRLLNVLSAAPMARSDFARRLAADYDANSDKHIDAAEFRRIFAEVQIDPAAVPEIGAGGSFSARRTLFPQMLYPSFSRNFALASYQAQAALGALDLDGDGAVSFAELEGTAKPVSQTPLTPEARADALLARYDKEDKGYVIEADLVVAWTADPSLGDPARAALAIEMFDLDLDSKVTRAEAMASYAAMDKADAILAIFDPLKHGFIDLAVVGDVSAGDFADMTEKFTGWDFDSNGSLSRQELIAGLQLEAREAENAVDPAPSLLGDADPALVAAMLLARHDANRNGSFSQEEFVAAAGEADFNAWDSDADGALTLEELQSGIAEIRQAETIVAQYDSAGKGWFDASDMAAALDSASTENIAERVAQIMAFWDGNGDGKVSVAEVVAGVALGGFVGGEQLRPEADAPEA
jgi:Ca2+-binding EF-hand superfamily protein